ncbi:MAG: hypothetical protein RLZZ253_2486 [Verrucomicrobiota bacterium]
MKPQPNVQILPAPSGSATLPVSIPRSLRELGRDEAWLQKFIFENPSVLGLGELQGVRRERTQHSGGRLDLLLTNPENDDMYEVEVMLGATDESHIIRTLEYWDAEKRRWPQRKHTAVLVAERITSRFYNVIHLLSVTTPVVGIQCNALEIDGRTGIHFTKMIDGYVEPDVDIEEEANPQDEQAWITRFPEQVKVARKLTALASDCLVDVELRFAQQYLAIRAGRYDRVRIWSRKRDHVQVGYRMEEEYLEEAVAACEAAGVVPSLQKRGELQFLTDLKGLTSHEGLHTQLFRWVNSRELQFRPPPEGAPLERAS